MHQTHPPLLATTCLGAAIARVHVFATHITYEQKFGRDITVAGHMIALVEKWIYEYGFVILTTTSRRRIICMVAKNRVDRLYKAIQQCTANPRRNSPEVIAPV
jgi:hypothetical protein